jgi:hypothetical protein
MAKEVKKAKEGRFILETSSIIFYDSEKRRITKTENGKFRVYDKKKKTTIGEFDTLRKATSSMKIVEATEIKPEWIEPKPPKKKPKRKQK